MKSFRHVGFSATQGWTLQKKIIKELQDRWDAHMKELPILWEEQKQILWKETLQYLDKLYTERCNQIEDNEVAVQVFMDLLPMVQQQDQVIVQQRLQLSSSSNRSRSG
jgi:hypothetical protein